MNQRPELRDDFELLGMMLADSQGQPPLHRPGPYWASKARNAFNEIQRSGIAGFRGSNNLVGLSYADNTYIDVRDAYGHGLRRLVKWLTKTYPLSAIYDSQVRLTESHAHESIRCAQELLNLKETTGTLLRRYTMPYSLLGQCVRKATIGGHDYSIHYLSLLEQHDRLASRVRFGDARSVFEIGGGFGANIHTLLENYNNIRKVLYLDIPPNLYVGTQYLKAFYGTAVSDYRALRGAGSIQFSEDDSLEIMCIAPWQLESFRSAIDIFMNSHSFVEMPSDVVKNYAATFRRLPGSVDAAIALTTYDRADLQTTLAPAELPAFFEDRSFDYFEGQTLLDSARRNFFFVSPGRLALQ